MKNNINLETMCGLLTYESFSEYYAMCKTLESAMYSVKQTIPDLTQKIVFVQDFAAALNRRHLLQYKKHSEFMNAGLEYMES